jgi:hypothetical protein
LQDFHREEQSGTLRLRFIEFRLLSAQERSRQNSDQTFGQNNSKVTPRKLVSPRSL